MGDQKTKMLIGIRTVKARLRRFWIGTRTLLRNGLEAMHVTFWQTCLHFVHILRLYDAEFKGGRPINLVKEILKQPNIQAAVWVLLALFSQIYIEKWGQ